MDFAAVFDIDLAEKSVSFVFTEFARGTFSGPNEGVAFKWDRAHRPRGRDPLVPERDHQPDHEPVRLRCFTRVLRCRPSLGEPRRALVQPRLSRGPRCLRSVRAVDGRDGRRGAAAVARLRLAAASQGPRNLRRVAARAADIRSRARRSWCRGVAALSARLGRARAKTRRTRRWSEQRRDVGVSGRRQAEDRARTGRGARVDALEDQRVEVHVEQEIAMRP